MRENMRNARGKLYGAALAGAALLAASPDGHAQSPTSQRAKGIVGGGMLGGEIVLIGEAVVGVKPGWAYILGGVAGTASGAVAGYYLVGGSTGKGPSFMLAGGIAFAIPTIIAVVSARQFQPPENYRQDVAPDEEPPLEETAPAGARLDLPSLDISQAFTEDEMHEHGVRQATEVHLSLFRGVF